MANNNDDKQERDNRERDALGMREPNSDEQERDAQRQRDEREENG